MSLTEMIVNFSRLEGRTISQARHAVPKKQIWLRDVRQSCAGEKEPRARGTRGTRRAQPTRLSPAASRGPTLRAQEHTDSCKQHAGARSRRQHRRVHPPEVRHASHEAKGQRRFSRCRTAVSSGRKPKADEKQLPANTADTGPSRSRGTSTASERPSTVPQRATRLQPSDTKVNALAKVSLDATRPKEEKEQASSSAWQWGHLGHVAREVKLRVTVPAWIKSDK